MLNQFLDWGSEKCLVLVRHGYSASVILCEVSSNTGAIINIESDGAMARITVWSSGDVYLEIVDILSEKTTYGKHLSLSGSFDFDVEFSDFFNLKFHTLKVQF
ncbi:MAG: hypothetical protein O9337_06555 [Acidovorax sp.]|uniref:immunity protein TriTu family protein n=1 Tax=Acidovorax sp. TaxID=1872122 RepID=UPI0022C2888C|nr:hypothetical protein [Acidovorax sp.]MCZ8219060.1 hypothetical protein [Acidovorax sp.]